MKDLRSDMIKLMKVLLENQEVNKKLHTEENKDEENKASLDIAVFEEEVVTNKESENQLVSFLLLRQYLELCCVLTFKNNLFLLVWG